MSILVVGSVALDTVETPHGKADDALGGSALFFSTAASFFSPVNLVGVVGNDFDFSKIEFLKEKQVDLSGLVVEEGETFRWGGKYKKNINLRDTIFTDLNVFQDFKPTIPEHYRNSELTFLANIDPDLQLDVLDQIDKPRISVLDTMNFWISGKPKSLMRLLEKVDILILNDEELVQLTDVTNLYQGAMQILNKGPKAIVIKKGEHGAVLVSSKGYFLAPAYPVRKVVDPTGAGDSFAGGFMGYLSTCEDINDENLRQAVVYGNITASFTVEDFSFNRLKEISLPEISERVASVREMTRF